MLQYANNNNCSDAALQYAIGEYVSTYSYNVMILKLGMAFVIVSGVVAVAGLMIFGHCRATIARCCGCR